MKININWKKISAPIVATVLAAGVGLALFNKSKNDEEDKPIVSSSQTEEPTKSITEISTVESYPSDTTYAYFETGENKNGETMCMLNISFKFDENGRLVGDYAEELSKLQASEQVPMGIIIKLQDYSLAEVYLAIDEIKKIMSQYIVNFPVYYDIDSILSQEKYKDDEYAYNNNYKMMVAFLEKAAFNGMFVGLSGSKENMDKYKQTFIDNGKQDLYVDTDILLYTNDTEFTDCHMIKCDGKYYSSKDYDRIIAEYSYNLASNFKDDYIYVVEPGDSMGLIQEMFDISNRENLYRCNYNYFESDRRVFTGQEIKIPMLLKEGRSDEIKTSDISPEDFISSDTEYVKGIDISVNNIIDWSTLKESNQVDFAVLRFCNTYYTIDKNNPDNIDGRFASHYQGCKENNIPVSFYIYCQWHSYHNEQEMLDNARKEAEHFVNYIKEHNYEPDYNVLFFDYEGSGADGQFQAPACKGEMIEKIMQVHKEVVEESGFKYGCYSNPATIRKIDMSKFSDAIFWIAGGAMYGNGERYNIENISEPTVLNGISSGYSSNPTEEGVVIQQITSGGRIAGSNSRTDINLMPKDWLDYLKALQQEKVKQKVYE